ncbi:hypothetical protein [Sphingomonas sp. RS2018]
MLFTTPTQFAVLAVCLLAGWLFGLATHPGGKKAKARLRALESEHAIYRKEAEARIKAAEAEHATYRKDTDARIAAAEADRERLARTAPVAPVTRDETVRRDAAVRDDIPVERTDTTGVRPAFTQSSTSRV